VKKRHVKSCGGPKAAANGTDGFVLYNSETHGVFLWCLGGLESFNERKKCEYSNSYITVNYSIFCNKIMIIIIIHI
jgi:hypothetical protein